MTKLITATLAASALALSATAASAGCFGHQDVTASAKATSEAVVMSTYDGDLDIPAPEDAQKVAKAAETCAEGQKDCGPATK